MKKILFILSIISFLFSSNILLGPLVDTHAIEHSIGISDKLGILGIYTQTWNYKDEYTKIESYYTIGSSFILLGGAGFGVKYLLPALYEDGKNTDYDNLIVIKILKRMNPYVSLTGYGYYILGSGGLATTGSIGIDMHIIKWEKINLGVQLGLISTYDFTRGNFDLTLAASEGPEWIMPSINIKANLKQK